MGRNSRERVLILTKERTMTDKNYFEALNKIDVSAKIEKKGNLSYLSWVWAWAILKKHYPEANSKVYKTEEGCLYHTDGRTAWVEVGITANGIEHIEYYPVYDNRFKSISSDDVTTADANCAIQRGMTKAIARHGVGLYIYAGEDLPEKEPVPSIFKTAKARNDAWKKILQDLSNCNTMEDLKGVWFDETAKAQLKDFQAFDEGGELYRQLEAKKDEMKESIENGDFN